MRYIILYCYEAIRLESKPLPASPRGPPDGSPAATHNSMRVGNLNPAVNRPNDHDLPGGVSKIHEIFQVMVQLQIWKVVNSYPHSCASFDIMLHYYFAFIVKHPRTRPQSNRRWYSAAVHPHPVSGQWPTRGDLELHVEIKVSYIS